MDDLTDAAVFLMGHDGDLDVVNVGMGEDISIRHLELIAHVVGFQGRLTCDASKPDGTPQKVLDLSRLHALGRTAETGLRKGIESTYRWYLQHFSSSDNQHGKLGIRSN